MTKEESLNGWPMTYMTHPDYAMDAYEITSACFTQMLYIMQLFISDYSVYAFAI